MTTQELLKLPRYKIDDVVYYEASSGSTNLVIITKVISITTFAQDGGLYVKYQLADGGEHWERDLNKI